MSREGLRGHEHFTFQRVDSSGHYEYNTAMRGGVLDSEDHRRTEHGMRPLMTVRLQAGADERLFTNTSPDSWPNINREISPAAGIPTHTRSFPSYHNHPPFPPEVAEFSVSPGVHTPHSLLSANQYPQPGPVHPANRVSISLPSNARPALHTLWWGDLESWMDSQYVNDACAHMDWKPSQVTVPQPPAPTADGPPTHQPNNIGYCLLTFNSQQEAEAILSQVAQTPAGNPLVMPNSSRPYNVKWLSAVPPSMLAIPPPAPPATPRRSIENEYSIFVGDLAPETSNSDLVAVFRNPQLGLRNDRAPKFIHPFLSCKSAKIMLDPVTGVSKGYGFVRYSARSVHWRQQLTFFRKVWGRAGSVTGSG